MYRIRLISVGKTKEEWLDEAIQEYVKRLQPVALFEFVWAKNDAQLQSLAEKDESVICLDAAGKMYTSEQFSGFLLKELEKGGARLTFVIGGAEGLPAEMKSRYPLISLSPMTFTHQMARLILVEQTYRAFEIARGSRYHK